MERVITESGYSIRRRRPELHRQQRKAGLIFPLAFQPDAPTVIGVIAALLLIIFTGYLIIYNIFQISVIKDIRFTVC